MRKVLTRSGKQITLLNPNEKAAKAAKELSTKCHVTNDGDIKKNELGGVKVLTSEERSYRMGYLSARRDSADAHLAKTDPEKLKKSKEERKAKRKALRK